MQSTSSVINKFTQTSLYADIPKLQYLNRYTEVRVNNIPFLMQNNKQKENRKSKQISHIFAVNRSHVRLYFLADGEWRYVYKFGIDFCI